MLRYCGNNEWCFPSQKTLAKDMGCSDRYVRELIKELESQGLIFKKRKGYNRANNYKVAKSLASDRKPGSLPDKHIESS
jgi:biotin operon repressor